MLHYAINITSTEAELFVLRCGINQVIQIPLASLSLQAPFMQCKKLLISPCIHTNFNQLWYLRTSKSSSTIIQITLLNFGTVLVIRNSISMSRWTRIWRNSILFHFILAKHHGTLPRRRNVTTLLKSGIHHSKCLIAREEIFWIS